MKIKYSSIALTLLLTVNLGLGWSQTQTADEINISDDAINIASHDVAILNPDQTDQEVAVVQPVVAQGGFLFKPTLSLGLGMFTFYGDVLSNHQGFHPTVSRLAYELRLINPLTDYLDMNFYALFGQVSGHERTLTRNLNFNSNITTGGLTFTYNFSNLRTWKSKVSPFISAGVESVEFLSKSDLRDANGNLYHYWSNGLIMDRAEDDPDAANAVELQRDYTYESDLRELNLDGYEKYPERSWAFPVEVGANFELGEKVNFRVSTSMHFTMTDLIDNVTGESVGERVGTQGNDKFLFTSFSLTYDLSFGKGGAGLEEDSLYWLREFEKDTSDYDQDGVGDLADLCAKTGLDERPVDEFGCPLDIDKDGVSDNKDDQLDTPEGAPVDSNGVALTDDDYFEMYRMYKDSIGEFSASMDEVTNTSSSIGGNGPIAGRPGIVLPTRGKDSYTIVLGSDSTGITANDLHEYLSYKDFKVVDDGENVYYILGGFASAEEAQVAANQIAENSGRGVSVGEQVVNEDGRVTVVGVDPNEIDPDKVNPEDGVPVIATNGIVYKVQIGAFSKKITGKVFKDAGNLGYIKGDDGLWRYYSGTFDDKTKAAKHRIDMVENGYSGSFIVAFKDGERITLEEAGFEVNENYNDNTEESSTPTIGVVNPELIKFRVQVGAFEHKIPTDILDLYIKIGNIKPLEDEDSGMTKYFFGIFDTYEEAVQAKEEIQEKGLQDAFIKGDFNGKIISSEDALNLLK